MIKQVWIILLLEWNNPIRRTWLEWMWSSYCWTRQWNHRTHWTQPSSSKDFNWHSKRGSFPWKELRDIVGRGRNASKSRDEKNKGQRLKMVLELSQRLGVGATRLKQLQPTSNYQPDLNGRIYKGEFVWHWWWNETPCRMSYGGFCATDTQWYSKDIEHPLENHKPSLFISSVLYLQCSGRPLSSAG